MVTKVQTDLSAIKTQEKKKVYEHFIRSLKDSGGLASTNSFNNYDSARMSAVESFSEVKAPDGTKLSEKLKTVGTPDATTAAQSITTALEQSDNYKNAKKDFNTDLTNLNELLLAGKYSLGDAASYLLEATNTAVDAIEAQQTLERDNLSKLFEKDDFKTQMKTALGCTDAELQAILTQMTADLKKSHEKLDEFKKGLQDNANQLFKKAEQEYWRISFLGHRYLSNKTMREEIDRLAAEAEKKKDPTLSMHSGIKGSDRLKHIDPTKLTTHVTVTGATLQASGEGAEFSLSTEFNRWYTTDHRIYATLSSIAEELKARGSDTITFQINDSDPDRAKEIAKKAFESAIIAGFPPDKINIKVNTDSLYSSNYDEKTKKAKVEDKLFTDDPPRLQFAKSKFQKGAEEREAFIKGNNTGKLKAELQDLKAKAREAEKSAAPRVGP